MHHRGRYRGVDRLGEGAAQVRLIVTEKDNTAKRIATILSAGHAQSSKSYGIPVYHFGANKAQVAVIGLKGHILKVDFPPEYANWQKVDPLDLVQAEIIKIPTYKNIVKALQKEAKGAGEVILATDFDREGELIGIDAANKVLEVNPDVPVKRARFSSLTEQEIRQAFDNLEEPYRNLAMAGESRQDIDLIWGAALTRVISLASSRLGKQFLSVGRVQTPTLVLLVEREQERMAFKSRLYWQITGLFERDGARFEAGHKTDRFWDEAEAKAVSGRLGDTATVESAVRDVRTLVPPSPFNTTTFLAAASGLGFSAAHAMRIAEGLYMSGLTSYPRTDNTYYPPTLNLAEVLRMLARGQFGELANGVLAQGKITATHGKRQATDHPPIYPTDVPRPGQLDEREAKIYELIVRRFLGTCSPPAKVESLKVDILASGEPFFVKGERVASEGWLKVYPYPRKKELILPALETGDELKLVEHKTLQKETQPPTRYRQGSLIQEMEKLGLGTKATRHVIIQNLYDRGYVFGDPIVPTNTGIAVAEALKRHATAISTPKMTAELEEEMDRIAEGQKDRLAVVDKSREILSDTVKVMQQHTDELAKVIWKGIENDRIVGKCPVCTGDLRIIRAKKSGKRFLGCSNYPNCTVAFPLPQYGLIQPAQEICPGCQAPKIKVLSKGRRPWVICPNMKCPTKETENAKGKT